MYVYIWMLSTGNIWNTIAFVKPTYITFPTFRPGSTADISFHFKTYRDHGVFLENSDDQLRNFIRIELNSKLASPLAAILIELKDFSVNHRTFLTFCFSFLFQPPLTSCLCSWSVMAYSMRLYAPLCRSMTTSGTLFRLRLT